MTDDADAAKLLLWKHSDAKGLLFKDLVDGAVPLEYDRRGGLTSRQIFEARYRDEPAFQLSDFDNVDKFGNRLSRLRQQIRVKLARANEDALALAHDRMIFPRPSTDPGGYPRWKGSRAQKLLIEDLKAEKHKEKRPMVLQLDRPEYQAFPIGVFRNKIYKELRKLKKGGRKKHGVKTR